MAGIIPMLGSAKFMVSKPSMLGLKSCLRSGCRGNRTLACLIGSAKQGEISVAPTLVQQAPVVPHQVRQASSICDQKDGAQAKGSKCFEVKAIPADQPAKVLEFIRQYYADEPLIQAVGLYEKGAKCEELERIIEGQICEGFSVQALSPEGKIIGVMVNNLFERDAVCQLQEQLEGLKDPKLRKVMQMLTTVAERVDIFDKYPKAKKVVQINIAAVAREYRNASVLGTMYLHARKLAAQQNVTLVVAASTSHFLDAGLKGFDFKPVYKLDYKDYKLEGNEPVFKVEQPHTGVTVFVKEISKSESGKQKQ